MIDVTVRLSTEPVELEELVVEVRSRLLDKEVSMSVNARDMGGIHRRETIEDRNPNVITDLFRTMSGLGVCLWWLFGPKVFVNQNITFSDGAWL
ncbi:MAG: hypothetical protein Ct9H300mP15_13980 [Gemmatimonadota bacterium]|nr:MAG: hypothetical protein Ct9H300mP15_13980 [Gemmatimonadota bacterium]